MAKLSAAQIAGVIAGGPSPPAGTSAAEWVALGLRESSGRTDVASPSGRHIGIWQIGVFHHPLLVTQSGATSEAAFREWLKQPANNWRAAVVVYGRQGWGAWEASHAPTEEARQAVANPDGSGGGPGITDAIVSPLGSILGNPLGAAGDAAEAIGNLAEVFAGVFEWITDPNTWRRIVLVVAGGAVAIVAVNTFVKGTDYYQKAESAVVGVVSKGAVQTGQPSDNGGPMRQRQETKQ